MTSTINTAIKDFMDLKEREKAELLREKGVLLDSDVEDNSRINLFYLNGFFVEEVLNCITWEVKEIIPYKTGYRLETYLNKANYFDISNQLKKVG